MSIPISFEGTNIELEIEVLKRFYKNLNYGKGKIPKGEYEAFLEYAKLYFPFPVGLWGITLNTLNTYDIIDSYGKAGFPVLILGDPGTGKELTAKAIHFTKHKNLDNFIPVNCNEFMETVLESELFGHEKGAFTGADKKRIGLIELASPGTLFLDEIGDMPQDIQIKLLRFLNDRYFRRVGGNEKIKSNCRIICATNKNIFDPKIKKRQNIRSDFLDRIKGQRINLDSLAGDLVNIHFSIYLYYMLMSKKHEVNLQELSIYDSTLFSWYNDLWIGNHRDLQSIIEYKVIIFKDIYKRLIKRYEISKNESGIKIPKDLIVKEPPFPDSEKLVQIKFPEGIYRKNLRVNDLENIHPEDIMKKFVNAEVTLVKPDSDIKDEPDTDKKIPERAEEILPEEAIEAILKNELKWEDVEKLYIIKGIETFALRFKSSKDRIGKFLGYTRNTFRNRLKEYNITLLD